MRTPESDFKMVLECISNERISVKPCNNKYKYGLYFRFCEFERSRPKIIHDESPKIFGYKQTQIDLFLQVVECLLNHSDAEFISENEEAKQIQIELVRTLRLWEQDQVFDVDYLRGLI